MTFLVYIFILNTNTHMYKWKCYTYIPIFSDVIEDFEGHKFLEVTNGGLGGNPEVPLLEVLEVPLALQTQVNLFIVSVVVLLCPFLFLLFFTGLARWLYNENWTGKLEITTHNIFSSRFIILNQGYLFILLPESTGYTVAAWFIIFLKIYTSITMQDME